MATATEERLAGMRRRIDRLEEKMQSTAAGAKTRMQGYVATVKDDEAAARAAAGRRTDAVEAKLDKLDSDLDMAEHRLAAEIADDRKNFDNAVHAELRDWDLYFEGMRAKAAEKSAPVRTELEKAVADLKKQRTAIADSLAAVRETSGEKWREGRARILAALDELKSKADHAGKE